MPGSSKQELDARISATETALAAIEKTIAKLVEFGFKRNAATRHAIMMIMEDKVDETDLEDAPAGAGA